MWNLGKFAKSTPSIGPVSCIKWFVLKGSKQTAFNFFFTGERYFRASDVNIRSALKRLIESLFETTQIVRMSPK